MKDAVASKAAQTYVNQRIARYGEVRTLKIDSQRKTIALECVLRGEDLPVAVRVEDYEVRDSPDGRKLLRVGKCVCNRPWLETLLTDLARDREIPVPGWAASAL